MNAISDLKIIGIDPTRPPVVRKEAYIDLYFKLSHQAPSDWCEDFNKLGHQMKHTAKIDKLKGMVIETWIREMEEIPQHLDVIKGKIAQCNEAFLEKIRQKELAALAKSTSTDNKDVHQNKLNAIIATLNFD